MDIDPSVAFKAIDDEVKKLQELRDQLYAADLKRAKKEAERVRALEKVAEVARECAKPVNDFPKFLERKRKLEKALFDLDALNGGGDGV